MQLDLQLAATLQLEQLGLCDLQAPLIDNVGVQNRQKPGQYQWRAMARPPDATDQRSSCSIVADLRSSAGAILLSSNHETELICVVQLDHTGLPKWQLRIVDWRTH